MSDPDGAEMPGELLLRAYEMLDAQINAADGNVEPFYLTAAATLKALMLGLAEAQQPEVVRDFQRGQETLHAGDLLVNVGAACTFLATLAHGRLSRMSPIGRVAKAGRMLVDLNRIGADLTKIGYAMCDSASGEQAGHA